MNYQIFCQYCILMSSLSPVLESSTVAKRSNAWLTSNVVSGYPTGASFHHHQKIDWTWIEGSSSSNQFSVTNENRTWKSYPGARAGSAVWIDEGHILWLFGGSGFSNNKTVDAGYLLDDLWYFDLSAETWHFLESNTTENKGLPGSRQHAAACGVSNIMFLMFGGVTSDGEASNETWIYVILNNTWISLDEHLPVSPSARYDMVHWCRTDELFIYGGLNTTYHLQNDVWKFVFRSLTWEKVSVKTDQRPSSNQGHTSPLPRNGATSWVVHNNLMYMFGGNVKSGVHPDSRDCSNFVSDLWSLTFIDGSYKWVYIRGYTNIPCGHMGIYGTLGSGDSSTLPGCRMWAASFTGHTGDLYVIGGVGVDSTAYPGKRNQCKTLSDVWMFDLARRQWIWVDGSTHGNQNANHGQLRIQSVNNTPGSRLLTMAWPAFHNNSYHLFGGVGISRSKSEYMYYNDLWEMHISLIRDSDFVFLLPFSSGVLFLICFSGVMTAAILFGLCVFLRKCIDFPRHSPSRSPSKDYHIKYAPLNNELSLE